MQNLTGKGDRKLGTAVLMRRMPRIAFVASLLVGMAILLKRRRTRIERLEKLLALLHYDLASQLANGVPPYSTGAGQTHHVPTDPLRDRLISTPEATSGTDPRLRQQRPLSPYTRSSPTGPARKMPEHRWPLL